MAKTQQTENQTGREAMNGKAIQPTTAVLTLQRTFPEIEGIKQGFGKATDYIHLGNAAEGGMVDGLPAAEYYEEFLDRNIHPFGINVKLVNWLNRLGFTAEWYDPGTVYAYPT